MGLATVLSFVNKTGFEGRGNAYHLELESEKCYNFYKNSVRVQVRNVQKMKLINFNGEYKSSYPKK